MPLGPNPVSLSSGTTVNELVPLRFTAGAFTTVPLSGALEYDGDCFYGTDGVPNRQIIIAAQVGTITTSYAISTDSTGNQKLFNPTTNGAVNVGPNKSYLFEAGFEITNLSTVSGSIGFDPKGAGTATVSHQAWHCMSFRAAATSVPTAALLSYHRAASTACIAAASTVGQVTAFIKGKLVVTTSGTLIPSVFYGSSGVTAEPIVSQGAYFKLIPIGSDTFTARGTWT